MPQEPQQTEQTVTNAAGMAAAREPAKPVGNVQPGSPPVDRPPPSGQPPAAAAAASAPDDVVTLRKEKQDLEAKLSIAAQDQQNTRAYVQNLIESVRQIQAGAQPARQTEEIDFNEAFANDPAAAAQYLINLKTAPLEQNYLSNQAAMTRQMEAQKIQADKKLGKYFGKYEREVDEFLSKVPLNIRATPTSVENAFRFVMINHLDEVVADLLSDAQATSQNGFVEGAGVQASGRQVVETISPEEKRVADGLGMSEADYIKWRNV